jgi:uncharacterized membrane protein YuzA (DUF378 family)
MATSRSERREGLSRRLIDRAILLLEALVGIAVVAAIIGRTYGFSSTLVFIACGLAATYSGYTMVKMFSSLRDETLEITGRIEDEERAALEHEKLLLLQGIKELEADAAVGKVDAEDYQHLRKTAEDRALQIIHRIKDSDQRWRNEAEKYVTKKLGRKVGPIAGEPRAATAEAPEVHREENAAERRARRAYRELFDDHPVEMHASSAGRIACGGCHTENEEDARYCIGCGRPRSNETRAQSPQSAEGTV